MVNIDTLFSEYDKNLKMSRKYNFHNLNEDYLVSFVVNK